jgi:hypothetical protein
MRDAPPMQTNLIKIFYRNGHQMKKLNGILANQWKNIEIKPFRSAKFNS